MLRTLVLSLLLAITPLASAQVQTEPTRFGDLLVYHTLFNSSYLQPDVAANAGLERGPNQGVVNILVQRRTPEGPVPVDANVSGTVKNLLDQDQRLNFIKVEEENAIYYVANYSAGQRGMLRFEVTVQAGEGEPEHTLRFQQEFHPDA